MTAPDVLLADLEAALAGGLSALTQAARSDAQVSLLQAFLAKDPDSSGFHVSSAEEEAPLRPLRILLDELARSDPERLPWPADWMTRRDPGDAAACRQIWGEVLLHCLRDIIREAREGWETRTSRKNQVLARRELKPVAQSWLGSRDFHIVCAMAGLDGVAVADRFKKALATEAGTVAMAAALFPKGNRWDDRHAD